jgi:hypothetical protein
MRAFLPRSRPCRRVTAVVAAAVLAAGAVLAITHPGPRPADGILLAAGSAAAPGYCTGTAAAAFPAVNGITNKAGTQGGHLWWRAQADGTCIGTVVVDIDSGITSGSETLRVLAYDDAYPDGVTIIRDVIPAPAPGFYQFTFGVHQVFAGLSAVCVGAVSCVMLGAS